MKSQKIRKQCPKKVAVSIRLTGIRIASRYSGTEIIKINFDKKNYFDYH